MKKQHRVIVSWLSVVILLIGFVVPIAADTIEIETGFVNLSTPENAVRAKVNDYFEQRNAFLQGQGDNYPDICDWYQVDLTQHIVAMNQAGVVRVGATLEINEVHINEKETHAYAIEHLVYQKNGVTYTENIFHDFLLLGSGATWRVIDDAYFEEASSFASCSYVGDANVYEPMAVGDGSAA